MSPDLAFRADASSRAGENVVGNDREKEIIGSLGEALAGVNLAPTQGHPGGGFPLQTGAPFAVGSHSQGQSKPGWGYHDPPNQGRTTHAPDDPTTPQRNSKESMDRFLSQSPSQVLGRDVLKLSTGNLPNLGMASQQEENKQPDPFRPGIGKSPSPMPGASPSYGHPRTVSPASAVTGSNSQSSRSGSPYDMNSSRTIQAYGGYDNSGSGSGVGVNQHSAFASSSNGNGGMVPGQVPHQLHSPMGDNGGAVRVHSPYGHNMGVGGNNPAGFGSTNSPQAPPQANPQQQVLYMAVPTPDGRGQVLQPVQMVQLPGKQFAYVLQGNAGGMQPMPGSIPSVDPQQPMMVMPNQLQHQQAPSYVNGDGSGNELLPSNRRNGSHNKQTYHSGQYNDTSSPRQPVDEYQLGTEDDQNDPLAALYNTSQRPSLDALLGQVRRLSRDQVGCRLVQQALDEEGPSAATQILKEGLPFWGEAMVDPFGNYLFQKILEKITVEERIMLVKSISTRLVNASLNLHGTRSVQKIVELCSADLESSRTQGSPENGSAADVLTQSLAPAAARLCIDSHGNHVIQRILLKLGHTHSKFVFDAVAESVGDVARHRHGCCVIQRCLDSPPSVARSHLVMRIVDKSLELMQDAYGNYVVQYVLDVCSDDDVHAVCESVVGKVNILAIQKFSSNVMEKCLERCTDRTKEHYMTELSNSNRIRELMMDPFGNYVVQRALSVATHGQAVRLVEAMKPHLLSSVPGSPSGQRNGGVRNTAGGRRILAKISRRFPNFSLNADGNNEELYIQSKGHHRQHQQQPPQQQQQQYTTHPMGGHPYGHIPQQPQHNPQYGNMSTMTPLDTQQYNQQRPQYYNVGDTGYYQPGAHHMGQGGYPTY